MSGTMSNLPRRKKQRQEKQELYGQRTRGTMHQRFLRSIVQQAMRPAGLVIVGLFIGVSVLVALGCSTTFRYLEQEVMISSGRVYRLEGERGSAVLVAPSLNGRILTSKVGEVESLGFVSLSDIEQGDSRAPFNNFGGQDRFWIGPEAGMYGLFFKPGDDFDRQSWRAPPHLNRGAMNVESASASHLSMRRDMRFINYAGSRFEVRIEREVRMIPSSDLREELGVEIPADLNFVGSYSMNTMVNIGETAWNRDNGALCIWILGQYRAGPNVLAIAPFRDLPEDQDGPVFNDDYFGRVSDESPDRIARVDQAVVFRADARREGKFGLPPERCKGLAGSFDPDKNLLVVVKFDQHDEGEHYASFSWKYPNPEPYRGDLLQVYNANSETHAFYELESVSPCRELEPGQKISHRHANFAFQGDREALAELARKVLGVDLDRVLAAMPPASEE